MFGEAVVIQHDIPADTDGVAVLMDADDAWGVVGDHIENARNGQKANTNNESEKKLFELFGFHFGLLLAIARAAESDHSNAKQYHKNLFLSIVLW